MSYMVHSNKKEHWNFAIVKHYSVYFKERIKEELRKFLYHLNFMVT